ncbi:type II toxin-antitoxin system RelE/ParE family toxin [Oceanicola sp. 502str15]|uniref:type II toxin-antitoxin system RelE/ParE family toxin n=1 Tax=Oceanicola sp. 502str15 TaxID=2696061 RepID=UPI0020947048|nr:type II toxin-antitoxin system RelE/ParE family toxin [Oceanicola sp. 502str15]MCO6382545.1 type II toxin-antitoxin system RelE/ParE family toxin [Oceanicola sp. 502str15]
MSVVFLPSAARDLVWFRQYYRSVFPGGSPKASAHFRAAVATLEANPYAGRRGEGCLQVRELAIPRTPFLLIYRVAPTRIEVLRLWDTRQGGGY